MKVIVIDGQAIDNSLLLLYYTILFSLDYSHQFNLWSFGPDGQPSKHSILPMLFKCWESVKNGGQHWNSIGWIPRVCWEGKCMVYRQCYDSEYRRLAKLNFKTLTALETTLNYAKINFSILSNTNISFLERTIKYFITECLLIVK